MEKIERCITCGFPGCDRGTLPNEEEIPENMKSRKLKDHVLFQAVCDNLSMRVDLIRIIKRRRLRVEDSL